MPSLSVSCVCVCVLWCGVVWCGVVWCGVCVCAHMCVSMCVYIYVCDCECVCMCVTVYVWLCMCACMRTCMSVCVYAWSASVCNSSTDRFQPKCQSQHKIITKDNNNKCRAPACNSRWGKASRCSGTSQSSNAPRHQHAHLTSVSSAHSVHDCTTILVSFVSATLKKKNAQGEN